MLAVNSLTELPQSQVEIRAFVTEDASELHQVDPRFLLDVLIDSGRLCSSAETYLRYTPRNNHSTFNSRSGYRSRLVLQTFELSRELVCDQLASWIM